MININGLDTQTLAALRDLARQQGLAGYSRLSKNELIARLKEAYTESRGLDLTGGVLEVVQDGIGFLRDERLIPSEDDVYVSQSQIRRFGLRTGDLVVGYVRQPKEGEKYRGMLQVENVNGLEPETAKRRPLFERLTPIFPDQDRKSVV